MAHCLDRPHHKSYLVGICAISCIISFKPIIYNDSSHCFGLCIGNSPLVKAVEVLACGQCIWIEYGIISCTWLYILCIKCPECLVYLTCCQRQIIGIFCCKFQIRCNIGIRKTKNVYLSCGNICFI